ncbi:hypothetical protein [Cupriavidus campinensis]
MIVLERPVRLAVIALALMLAACGDKTAEKAPPAAETAAPGISVNAGDASVETSDAGTVVRAGNVSVSISNAK